MGVFDPLPFELVLGGELLFVIDAELSGRVVLGELEGGVSGAEVMSGFVDEFELAAFAWVSGVEGAGVEHGALGEGFDGGEAGVEDGALEHFVHVLHLRGVGAGDKGGTSGDELGHRVDWAIDGSTWVGLGFVTDGSGWGRLVLGQAVDVVVHDDIG